MDSKNIIQQAFEKVAIELLKQNEKSLGRSTSGKLFCMYRSPDGLKCAVGHLIDDKDYKPEMENTGVLALLENYLFDNSPLLSPKTRYFYVELQNIHDDYPVSSWKNEFYHIGHKFNLNTEFLDRM